MNNTTILPPTSEFCTDIFKPYFPLQHLIPGIAGLLQVLRLFHRAVFPQVRFAIKKQMPDTFLRGILYLQKKKKTQLCWQNGVLSSKNSFPLFIKFVHSPSQRQRSLECQLILLSPPQIHNCFYFSSTWLILGLFVLLTAASSFTVKTSLKSSKLRLCGACPTFATLHMKFLSCTDDQAVKQCRFNQM